MNERITEIVLVGGGLAAAKAAETIRTEGFDGHVTLVTEEPHRPYERPPLSKSVLIGDAAPDTAYVHSETFYDDHGIELVTGDPVTDIDRTTSKLVTRSGTTLPFDRVLIATGATPRRLPLEPLEGIVTLRTIEDALELNQRLRDADHVTVVGAGWIGCEVAAAARRLGTDVTMVDPLNSPLERVLGQEVGTIFADLHRDHGADLRLGVGISDASGTSHVEQVTLSDGSTMATDLVVVGIGVVPRTDLAERVGLDVDNGVLVDAQLVSSDPRILAAGDVANAWHPRYGRHVRVEHWANALHQGQTAAVNLLGARRIYDRLPYFYSDQYDFGMEYVGLAREWDQVIFRGDPASREFIAFWLSRGRVTAAMNVNVGDVIDDLKALIAAAIPVSPDRLAEPDVALLDLVGATR